MPADEHLPFDVSSTPFFVNADVAESIEQLSTSDRLVIFAGAGVTIDQTGLGWGQLMKKLLVDSDLVGPRSMSEERAQAAIDSLQPVEVATVLRELHRRRSGSPSQDVLASAIGKKLYSYQPWLDGALSSSVARMAIEAARGGVDVSIVTTNYETIIEDKLMYERGLKGSGTEVRVSVQGRLVREVQGLPEAGRIRLEYLHGRIVKGGSVDGVIALDELDYFNLGTQTSELLFELLTDADVLIVGSSLTDPPLLSALWRTRPGTAGRHRVALMPLPSMRLAGATRGRVDEVRGLHNIRMAAYGVEVLTPDFYSQVSQFCREVASSLRARRAQLTGAPVVELRYMARLQFWWDSWSRLEEEVHPAHTVLVRALENVRNELATSGHSFQTVTEVLRLELWMRRDPAGPKREMVVWSTSAGIMTDPRSRRSAPLTARSEFISIEAFAAGKPLTRHHPDALDQATVSSPPGVGRWRTFISTPISIEVRGTEIMVGAVTLASQSGAGRSNIDPDWAQRMSGVLSIMNSLGQQLLGLSGAWARTDS